MNKSITGTNYTNFDAFPDVTGEQDDLLHPWVTTKQHELTNQDSKGITFN